VFQYQCSAMHKTKYPLEMLLGPSFIVALMTVTNGVFGWGDPDTSGNPRVIVSEESKKLVKIILDDNTSEPERSAAYLGLQKGDPNDLKAGLRELLLSASSDVSRRAAMTVLVLDDEDQALKELIVQRMRDWPDGCRRDILNPQSAGKNSPRLRFVPRAVLEEAIRRWNLHESDPPGDTFGSLELAARILAFANDPQDEALFQRAVLARPSSDGLWLALGRRGHLPPEHARLARMVMTDPSQPYLARVAAAGAAAQSDPESARFVLTEIHGFLEEFGSRDMSPNELVKIAGSRVISGSLLEEENRFKQKKWILGNLLNIDTPGSEELTFQYLLAPDFRIRRALSIVAAKRWSERFLNETSTETYPEYEAQEYELLLALLVHLHPNLRGDVEARIPKPSLDKIIDRVQAGVPAWWGEEAWGFVMGW
jgi:hypothetical protein